MRHNRSLHMNRCPRPDGRKFRFHCLVGAAALATAGMVTLASCGGERPSVSEAEASALLSGIRARPASPLQAGLAERFVQVRGTFTPQFPTFSEKPSARVSLP